MARIPAHTEPKPHDHQQMNRSDNPQETRALDEAAPAVAMASRRQRFAGSAHGVGSVGFDEKDVFDEDDDPERSHAGG